jgi:hypothetical protein
MSRANGETSNRTTWARRLAGLLRWLHTYVSMLGFLALLFFAVTGLTLNHPEWFYDGQAEVREMQGRLEPELLSLGTAVVPLPQEPQEPSPSPSDEVPPPAQEEPAPPPIEEPSPPPVEESAPLPGELPMPAEEAAPLPEAAFSPPGDAGRFAERSADEAPIDKPGIAEALRTRHGLKGAPAEFTADEHHCMVSFHGPGYTATAFINRATGEYKLSEARHGLVAVLNDLHKGRATGIAWSWVIDVTAVVMTVASITGLALLLVYKRRRRAGVIAAVLGSLAVIVIYVLYVP